MARGQDQGLRTFSSRELVVDYRERMDGWMTLRVLSMVDLDSCYMPPTKIDPTPPTVGEAEFYNQRSHVEQCGDIDLSLELKS